MDFARRQLLKYGWSEGKGLGKEENGIPEALKPQLKFDTTGVGHDPSEQFTFNWWENVYNNAADNIEVVKTNDGSVNVKLNSDDSVDITTKKYSMKHLKKKNQSLEYGSFLKTSKLTSDGIVDHEDKVIGSCETKIVLKKMNLTDDELFSVCGGRTAHKGARHGLKLNGKLARIEEQEKLLLQFMKRQANELGENSTFPKYDEISRPEKDRRKSLKKSKKSRDLENCSSTSEPVLSTSDDGFIMRKKKSKKRKIPNSDPEDESVDVEAANKRLEYHIEKQKRKKLKIRKRMLDLKMSKVTDMLENVCVSQENKDDGFDESTKKSPPPSDEAEVKHKRKKLKKIRKTKDGSEDDGFEEVICDVSEKLLVYKKFRKDIQKAQRKCEDGIVDKMTVDFENTCEL